MQANAKVKQSTASTPLQYYAHAVWENEECRLLEFKHLIDHKNPETIFFWGTYGANEYGRLIQLIGESRKLKYRIKGMKSMMFIKNQLVKKKLLTYARFLENIQPQKY